MTVLLSMGVPSLKVCLKSMYLGVRGVWFYEVPQRNKLPHVTFLSVFTSSCTVKKAKERVRHPERMVQEHNRRVSKRYSDITVENCSMNIKLFGRLSHMSNLFDRAGQFQKQHHRVSNLCIQSDTLPAAHLPCFLLSLAT